MKHLTLVFIGILLFLSTGLFAQKEVPGYLGSKATLELNGSLLTLSAKLGGAGQFGYTVSRKVELIAGYGIATGTRTDGRNTYSYYTNGTGDLRYRIEFLDRNFGVQRSYIGMNIYIDEHLAPIGRHFKFAIANNIITPGRIDLTIRDNNQFDVTERSQLDDSFSLLGVEFGYYDRNILSGNFFMDYGASINYLLRGKHNAKFFSSGSSNLNPSEKDFVENQAPRDLGYALQYGQLVTLRLGAGLVF